jgi:putative ABC transport system ATP-binding protein
MLKLTNIERVYRTADIETAALQDVSFEVKQGEFLSIMGPSGCGKSTLLNILGMLDSPTAGSYRFFNEEVSDYPESLLAALRAAAVGFIFQSFNLIDDLSVADNVEVALLYRNKIPAAQRRQRVLETLDRVGIAHRAKHLPQQLSGGQQQRVAIARALIANPKLILADEPTGNLDSENGDNVMTLLTEVASMGTTIIMVTHSREHAEYAHRIIRLLDGKIVIDQPLVM